MSQPITLSVVLATHNEEKNLPKCLESIKSIADEIIIADGESTDQTLSIAKEFAAKVIKTTNKPNFHINKQMAMDEAEGKLVLQLDADELVDEELRQFISQIKDRLMKSPEQVTVKAWYLRRRNFFLGRFMKKGGQYPDPVIRLYQNGFARLPARDVHEQMEVAGPVATAEGHLLHYSNPDFSTYLRKWNDYTTLKAIQLEEAGSKPSFLMGWSYLCWKPKTTFLSLYFRHKGFMDGMAGFVFALMSGLYFMVSYLKFIERVKLSKQLKRKP